MRSRGWLSSFRPFGLVVLSLAAPFLAACSSGCRRGGPIAPPDTGSPLIEIVFPTGPTDFDRDGDGLIDIEIRLADSLSGVDPASIRLTSHPSTKGLSPSSELLSTWNVVRQDSAGFVVEETTESLLPRGRVELTVTAADRKGNTAMRTFALDLPPAARHKVIDLRADLIFVTRMLLAPDGKRLYVNTEAFSSTLSIVDPWSLEWLKTVPAPVRGFSEMVYDPARDRIYTMSVDQPFLGVFDVASETFLPSIRTSSRGIGVALSRRRDEVYVGLEVENFNTLASTALVSVVDIVRGVEARVVDLGVPNLSNPGDRMVMHMLLFDPPEERLYITTGPSAQQGVLVVDPSTGSLVGQVDLRPEFPDRLGGAFDLALDGNLLLAAEGAGRIAVVSLTDLRVQGLIPFGVRRPPGSIAVSPDRTEWLTETGDGGVGFNAVILIDAASGRTVWEERFPQPSDIRQDVAFRSDGNVFFTVSGRGKRGEPGSTPNELTVYLRRSGAMGRRRSSTFSPTARHGRSTS